ncbi:hypothetical protein MBLNU457_2261t1 [Dothideomycetes sp. NU457]
MSSDSELSSNIPDDSTLEAALRSAVVKAKRAGDIHSTTVNTIRASVESKFDLTKDYFKSDPIWKQRSKDVVNAAFEELETFETKPEPSTPPKKQARKRASAGQGSKPSKRRRTATAEDDLDEGVEEESEQEQKPAKKVAKKVATNTRRRSKPVVDEDSEDDVEDEKQESEPPVSTGSEDEDADGKPSGKIKTAAQDSESEMSDVKDEPPPSRKKRQKESKSAKSKAKPAAKPKTKARSSTKEEASPDDDEIKRLQGWLIKCGIRKLWGKELAPYDTPKAKINHLKAMLKEAGMEGRYSVEKASAIKERRELAADLEAVKEGNENWGRDSEENKRTAARRRAPSSTVDFSDDDEDSDKDSEEDVEAGKRKVASRFIDFGSDGEDSE